MSDSIPSGGSVHPLPVHRGAAASASAAAPSDLASPKQQMLAELEHLHAAVEAGFITGLDILSGTHLGEPTRRVALGTFAHDPLDTLLLGLHSLYRAAFELRQEQLMRQVERTAA